MIIFQNIPKHLPSSKKPIWESFMKSIQNDVYNVYMNLFKELGWRNDQFSRNAVPYGYEDKIDLINKSYKLIFLNDKSKKKELHNLLRPYLKRVKKKSRRDKY